MIEQAQSQDTDASPSSSAKRRKLAARLLTELFAPAPVAAALLVVVTWHATADSRNAVLWSVVAVVFASVLPIGYVLLGVRRRKLSDRHVAVRHQRRSPLIVSIAFVLLGLLVLKLGGAPSPLVALVTAMAAGLAASLLVTLVWKVSIHTAVVAGSEAILVLVFGPWLLTLTPVVVLVAWARLQLGQHTVAQVIAGIALGTVVATSVYSVLA